MVEDVYRQGLTAIRKASQILRSHFLPQAEGVQEPRKSEAPKGRPPRRNNARDPSWCEHERGRSAKKSITSRDPRT
ncbi:unnamed protein product [Linum tenue]|uniref:Uncharacterized protein n=1 Tax=Linum tenue TaxID=586396 RepID=A0AAV0PVI6_9ROSI|nr:unnamed protein product [Linum tenue]